MPLAQSTSRVVMLKLFLSSDARTAATGKTVAITISKAGGAFGNPNAGATNATEVSSGWYKVTLDTTDTNTLGDLVVRGTATACDDSERTLEVEAVALSATDVWAVATRSLTILDEDSTTLDLDATIRAALGLAAANLDIQIDALPTNAELAAADDAVLAAIAALNNLSAAQVNAEMLDVFTVDTFAEPGQGVPPATTSLANKIGYPYKAWRNKKTVTATTFSLFADDASTVDQKSTISDAGGTFTEGEKASGP